MLSTHSNTIDSNDTIEYTIDTNATEYCNNNRYYRQFCLIDSDLFLNSITLYNTCLVDDRKLGDLENCHKSQNLHSSACSTASSTARAATALL